MSRAALLAQEHWNATPLFLSEEQRYSTYPWLYEAGEFRHHAGQNVLEVGCGTGCDLLQFAKHGAIATGVDITDRHLEIARQRVGDLATVIKGDIRELPLPDNSFDYVYSHGVLHHSDEPQRAAQEILRVLKPGARFNVHLYALISESTAVYFLKHGFRWRDHVENSTDPVHIDLYTARRFRKLFPDCDLSFRKYQTHFFPFLQSSLGWFLVGTGQKRT
jgi:ubiquinone/menaquinone biosynthesis C-methylase UbiE